MKHMEEAIPLDRPESPRTVSEDFREASRRPDPLRRRTPTSYTAGLPVMGHTVKLKTNDRRILERAVEVFAPYPGSLDGDFDFVWRIVVQSHPQMTPPWPKRSAFSGEGLRFVEFGQRNFLAVDLEAREGIGFLAEGLAKDRLGLICPFLENLFLMSVGSLGLTSLRAACVTLGDKGLLVFGPPNSGKTTASYLATKLGLQFHADEGVFLELETGNLLAWGGFWPIAFRPETLQFLPELQGCARAFSYLDFTFYYVDQSQFQAPAARPVTPVCCVFLERNTVSVPHVSPLSSIELSRRLAEDLLFKDDDRFAQQRAAVLRALERLPAYHLAYGEDPATAAELFPSLLTDARVNPT